MKVLLAHNFYNTSTPSGENRVYEAERKLLQSKGHTIDEFTRYSDDIIAAGSMGTFRGALATPWNPFMLRSIRRRVRAFEPHVVHVHNTFPLLSPSIFYGIGSSAARVLTLHNYRLYCPAAIPMRDQHVCTDCLDRRSSLPAITHGCYRGNRLATLPLAIGVSLHRMLGTWLRQVDAFVVLSDFQREVMVAAGLPANKVYVRPNFYSGEPRVVPWIGRQPYVIFAGRLSHEKGVATLVRAWQQWGSNAPELRIAGDGELRDELRRMATGLPIRFLGQLDSTKAQAQIAGARLQILPSEWFEGFPMVVCEGFAFGTPTAVSDIGPLSSIVEHDKSGIVFEAGNPKSLLTMVRSAWTTPGLLERLGRGARLEFEEKYTEEAGYAALLNIYQSAIKESKRDG